MGNVAPAAAENSTKLGDLAVHHPPHFHADRRVALRSFPDIDYLFEAPLANMPKQYPKPEGTNFCLGIKLEREKL